DQPLGAFAAGSRTLDYHVSRAAVDGDRDVAGQRPGRRRPHQEEGAGLVLHREAHKHARISDFLVPLRDFVAAQRRAAARAVGDDLETFVQQALVPELAQDPPYALDVLVLVRDVRVFEIDPERDPLGELFPFLDVAEDALAALFVVARDAVFLDVALVLEAELFLDLDLDRQAVR